MQQINVCPDCATEYLAHVNVCADCGTRLLSREENRRVQEERQRCMDTSLEERVVVREGELNWIKELYAVLIESGIPCAINADKECKKGCCGGRDRLFVSYKDLQKAQEIIDEYYASMHPEMRTSEELINQGKCPACGTSVDSGATECPDCGLMIMIIE